MLIRRFEVSRECTRVKFSSDGNMRLRWPIRRFRYLLLPDDRTLSDWLRGSDGMLLSCVTIVGQRESYLSPLSETDMSIFELTHTHPVPLDINALWHSSYEVFEFNQLAHAFEMRPSRVWTRTQSPINIKYHYGGYWPRTRALWRRKWIRTNDTLKRALASYYRIKESLQEF